MTPNFDSPKYICHAIPDNASKDALKIINAILEIPFSWKTLLFHSDNGYYIRTCRENFLQKYCWMLDFILPFKDKYEAAEVFIAPEILEKEKNLRRYSLSNLKYQKSKKLI